MHWIYLIHKFHNLSWITEINELFHDILIYWDVPVCTECSHSSIITSLSNHLDFTPSNMISASYYKWHYLAFSIDVTMILVELCQNIQNCENMSYRQWWSVTKYNYFVTVLKYIFQVSVLYWSSFILSNFYFYFTTFQSIRSYFLLHYIS